MGVLEMYCHQCGSQNSENARFCSKCGTSLKSTGIPKSTKILLTIFIMSGLLLAGASVYFFPDMLTKKEEPIQQVAAPLIVPDQEVKEENLERDKTVIIKEALPKVFTILTRDGQGSGFLYKKGGYIITNAHVVAGYTDVIVRNSSGKDSEAKVIGISDKFDVALIKAENYAKVQPLPIEMKESVVGTEVIALGTPQGLENSASIGYLTGIGRNIEYGFTYKDAYQIDAQIDQGSSGGPLLDAKTGKVIGINSLLYQNNNSFGFSIPMYSVRDLADSWVQSPMSGIEIARLFDVYEDNEYYEYESEPSAYFDEYFDDDYDMQYEDYEDYYFDYESLKQFILYFRENYEMALYYEDFYWIEDMLLPGSEAYHELEHYISSIAGQDMSFDFIDNEVLNVEIYGQYAIVTTFEQFYFTSPIQEKAYERTKDYTVVINEDGYYQITNIFIYE